MTTRKKKQFGNKKQFEVKKSMARKKHSESNSLALLKKKKDILEQQVLKYDFVKKEITVAQFLECLRQFKKEFGGLKEWSTVDHLRYANL